MPFVIANIRKGADMQQYAIYLRKSRADLELEARGELETLATHEKHLMNLAKKMNLNVTAIYKEVVSGETIEARPYVQQLLNEVEQGLWTGVLVMEIERLARGDTIDQGIVARAFKISGTKIITPIKTYDPQNEFDEEYFEFSLFMSRREYKTITRRIQRGRIASAKEGRYLASTPPYGYNKIKIPNDKGYTLQPNHEASTVKSIFNFYINGYGANTIATKLDSMNIKPRVKETWAATSIRDILKNPVYIGKIRWSYKKEKKFMNDGEMKKQRRKNEDCIFVNGLHEAIIDEDTFYKAQELLKTNRKQPVKSSLQLQNPLTGLVYCQKCGKLMTRLGPNTKNKYSTLKCPNVYCNNVSAPLFLVEKKIINSLHQWVTDYKININQLNNMLPIESALKTKESQLNKLKSEAITLKKQISNTYDLVEQGIYTKEVFIERNKALTESEYILNKKLEQLNKSIDADRNLLNSKLNIIPAIESVIAVYNVLEDPKNRNNLLRQVLDRVEYIKDTPNTRGKLLNNNFKLTIYPRLPKL